MQSVKENLLAAFRYLLRPLVRIAVKNAVVFPELSGVLKQAYVDVAGKQMAASGKEPTEEGISLIANITTADVHQILQCAYDANLGVAALEDNPLPTILNAWHTNPKYTGPYGVVRDIPFSRAEGTTDAYTFSQLAADSCPGVSPKELLDELLRTGCVQDVGNGFYRAIKRSYVPDPLSARNILLFARVVHNVCESAEVNLRAESVGGKGLIERTIYTVHGIPRQDLPAFDKFIRQRGQVFADDIDNWLSDLDKEGLKDSVRTGVGFYHYIVNEDDERALPKELLN